LSSLFINRSFNTFRFIQCEQFKEKLSGEIRCWGQADRHFAAHYCLFLGCLCLALIFITLVLLSFGLSPSLIDVSARRDAFFCICCVLEMRTAMQSHTWRQTNWKFWYQDRGKTRLLVISFFSSSWQLTTSWESQLKEKETESNGQC
jgi:hypothetical protein